MSTQWPSETRPSFTTKPPDTAVAARSPGPQPAQQKSLRSPELRARRGHVARPIEEDQGDEDSLSFPSSNYIEDLADVEDVYADFGVIFGGAAERDEDVSGNGPVTGTLHAAEHLEEYMDDLDGIPPAAR
ncbi:hypothetical protein M406DRAFT_70268 [Cryphonectria parasitica EP155]|uniref:Uncharacterized protein n=1 Tax=Cryphonectria parasitica (strain ATCC 38755 / EP155) TaxID=660469 RepID=A0A9P4Y268_CRYP1|nr:uncharacterized protein M406DRAFT_70268 [Cryphonectria parasitica EP155]KAF3765241.1 hypothetical protein M406DRAFT_70268 [Cryphonectria parasitica EP155]